MPAEARTRWRPACRRRTRPGEARACPTLGDFRTAKHKAHLRPVPVPDGEVPARDHPGKMAPFRAGRPPVLDRRCASSRSVNFRSHDGEPVLPVHAMSMAIRATRYAHARDSPRDACPMSGSIERISPLRREYAPSSAPHQDAARDPGGVGRNCPSSGSTRGKGRDSRARTYQAVESTLRSMKYPARCVVLRAVGGFYESGEGRAAHRRSRNDLPIIEIVLPQADAKFFSSD